MRGIDVHLAVEQAAEAHIVRTCAIQHHDVRKLMYGGREKGFCQRDGLVGVVRRGDVDENFVPRCGVRCRVSAVRKVLEENIDPTVGFIIKQSLVYREAAEEALRDVRHQRQATRIEVNDPQILGLGEILVRPDRCCHGEREDEGSAQLPRGLPAAAPGTCAPTVCAGLRSGLPCAVAFACRRD